MNDSDYYSQRLAQARESAARASGIEAAAAHLRLAALYEERLRSREVAPRQETMELRAHLT